MKKIILIFTFLLLQCSFILAQKYPDLKEGEAKELIFLFVEMEYKLYNAGSSDGFEQNGYAYTFLPEEISTKEKLDKYLGEVYAPEARENLIKELGLIEKEGRLAKIAMGGGTLEDWDNCEIEPLKTHKEKAQLAFYCTVPTKGDAASQSKSKYKFIFLYVKKVGWRVLSKSFIQ